jgi:uncharacterized protein YebE (UPF0316 family)
MEPEHYLTLQAIKKLKADVVDQMEVLISVVSLSLVLEFDHMPTPHNP